MTHATAPPATIGVLLLSFGSATSADDVPAFMASVRGGRPVSPELLDEFRRRYAAIGRSPLLEITQAQAEALQRSLDAEVDAPRCRVAVGMLHSQPRVAEAVDALHESGVRTVIALVLAPQYSAIILAGYERALAAARQRHPDLDIRAAGAWHDLPEWITSLGERVRDALAALPELERATVPVIFTAHSLPRAVVDRDPGYIEQLRDTARRVAENAGIPAARWQFAYQSAGHTPEEWLTPDLKDLLPGLRERGVASVLVVPVQFLADHLEILYDIDIAARQEAAVAGITMHRIAMPNTSPQLIAALRAVVARQLSAERRETHPRG